MTCQASVEQTPHLLTNKVKVSPYSAYRKALTMSVYEEALLLTDRMTLTEKARLLEYLSASLRQALEAEAYRRLPWEAFIALTYGSLADDPLERWQPTAPDVRDTLE